MLLNPNHPQSISDVTQAIHALNSQKFLTVVINLSREDITANHISKLISSIVQSGVHHIQQHRLFITTKSVFLEYSFGLNYGTSDLMVILAGLASYFPKIELCLVYDQQHELAKPFISTAIDKSTSVVRGMDISKVSNWCLIETKSHLGLLVLKLSRFVTKSLRTFWKLPFEFRNNRSITHNMKLVGRLHCVIPADLYGNNYQLWIIAGILWTQKKWKFWKVPRLYIYEHPLPVDAWILR